MIDSPNYDTQKDEVELLRNILFDKLTIEEEEPLFILNIEVQPDVQEETKLFFTIKITLIPEYPDKETTVEIEETSNILPSSKISKLKEEISLYSNENLGMPMIYQIYEMIKVNKSIKKIILYNNSYSFSRTLRTKKRKI